MTVSAALLVHAAATFALVGLIWIVQVVLYPLFSRVGPDRFVEYHTAHCRRIGFLVGVLIPVEAVTAVLVVLAEPGAAAVVGLSLVAVNLLATAFLAVPLHDRLARGFDATAHRRLVRTNWLRTTAWSARGVLVALLLA